VNERPSAAERSLTARIASWTWAHRVTAIVFLAVLVLGRQAWFPYLKGSLTATRLFALVPFVDPLSGLEVMLASGKMTTTLLIGMSAATLIAVLLGRVFCGWLCPLGLVLDLNDHVRQTLRRRWPRLFPKLEIPKLCKYYLLGFCLILSTLCAVPVFTTISPINLTALAVIQGMRGFLVIAGVLIVLEFIFRRGFCRSLCPLGAFYSLLGRFAFLKIRIRRTGACRQPCRQCTLDCPMGIRIFEDHVSVGKRAVADPECTRCGACADTCPNGLLRLP